MNGLLRLSTKWQTQLQSSLLISILQNVNMLLARYPCNQYDYPLVGSAMDKWELTEPFSPSLLTSSKQCIERKMLFRCRFLLINHDMCLISLLCYISYSQRSSYILISYPSSIFPSLQYIDELSYYFIYCTSFCSNFSSISDGLTFFYCL